jgi:hypothetical protein
MGGGGRVLGLVAVVVSVVVCLPLACCPAFLAAGYLLVSPATVERAPGSGAVPSFLTLLTVGGGSACVALVALGLGIFGLVWGIRALRRPSAEQAG